MSEVKKGALVLDAALIVKTIEKLQARIEARFPSSGLSRLCIDLVEVGRTVSVRARALNRPYIGMRALGLSLFLIWLGLVAYIIGLINWPNVLRSSELVNFAQPLDSIVNLTVLMGAASWFVWTWEHRLKRKRVFRALYQLRSLAHVIDMYQLTKDPSVELSGGTVTSVSPERVLSDFELSRYLDYCSEMLALIAKLAALYAGRTEDGEIVAAANDVEDLTTNLGRKIWQKIMIISNIEKDQPKTA